MTKLGFKCKKLDTSHQFPFLPVQEKYSILWKLNFFAYMPKCDELRKVGDHKSQETLQTNSHLDQWPNKGRKEYPQGGGGLPPAYIENRGCSWSATKC
jgi:hypothetical protein